MGKWIALALNFLCVPLLLTELVLRILGSAVHDFHYQLRQAAMLLQEIARGRRAERIGARDKKKRVSFQYIIAECIERASPEIEVDCNSLLESLMAETSLGEVVGAVNQQGFQAAHEYGRAATVLQEIARQRRRLRSKEGDGGVGLGDQK